MNVWSNGLRRLERRWGWVTSQFVSVAVILLLGLAWTRIPDRHGSQVALTIVVPVLLLIAMLLLQAGTMRALTTVDGRRVRLAWGTLALLGWLAVLCLVWTGLNWFDDHIPQWAGYLNSQSPAHWRAQTLTYQHLVHWLTMFEWVLRWIVLPGILIVCAVASAQWGWVLRWRRVRRVLLNWRWWPTVTVAALVTVKLPSRFFTAIPQGTVQHQVWMVAIKLAGAYALAVCCWVFLLALAAALLERGREGSFIGG